MTLQSRNDAESRLPTAEPLMRLSAFRKLWMASAFEGVGDEASRVLIPIIAVSMLGAGALEVGVINALAMSAFLVLGLPIGVWVDRLRRRRLMIAADVFRALVVLSLPTAFLAGGMTIGHLLVGVALISVADVVFTTAHGVFVPAVVGPDRISDAHARLQSAASAVAVGSPSLTGALLSAIAAPLALVTAGISYTLSALALRSIKVVEDVEAPQEHDQFWEAARAGLSFTLHHPVLRGLFLSGMLLNAATMFGSAATAVYALNVLELSPAVFALLSTFAALGGLAASFAAPAMLRQLGIGRTRILGGIACIPAVALTPLAPVLPWFPALWLGVSTFGWAFLVVVISVAGARYHPAGRTLQQARNSHGQQQTLRPRNHASRQPCRGRRGHMDRCPTRALDLVSARRRLRRPHRTLTYAELDNIPRRLREFESELTRATARNGQNSGEAKAAPQQSVMAVRSMRLGG